MEPSLVLPLPLAVGITLARADDRVPTVGCGGWVGGSSLKRHASLKFQAECSS